MEAVNLALNLIISAANSTSKYEEAGESFKDILAEKAQEMPEKEAKEAEKSTKTAEKTPEKREKATENAADNSELNPLLAAGIIPPPETEIIRTGTEGNMTVMELMTAKAIPVMPKEPAMKPQIPAAVLEEKQENADKDIIVSAEVTVTETKKPPEKEILPEKPIEAAVKEEVPDKLADMLVQAKNKILEAGVSKQDTEPAEPAEAPEVPLKRVKTEAPESQAKPVQSKKEDKRDDTQPAFEMERPKIEGIKAVAVSEAQKLYKPPAPAEQIETEVIRGLEEGKMEFAMKLAPANLGMVEVKMVFENGSLVVEIMASSKSTGDMLAKEVNSIAAMLNQTDSAFSSVQVVTASESREDTGMGSTFLNQSGQEQQESTYAENSVKHSEDLPVEEITEEVFLNEILNYKV